jgi:hypothetical protein
LSGAAAKSGAAVSGEKLGRAKSGATVSDDKLGGSAAKSGAAASDKELGGATAKGPAAAAEKGGGAGARAEASVRTGAPAEAERPHERAEPRRKPGRASPPASGMLTLDTDPWATVYLAGRKLGTTPFARVAVPAGRRELVFDLRDSGTRRRLAVKVAPGTETRLTLKLP